MVNAPAPATFGPYAEAPPDGALLGAPIRDLERSFLFTATRARMRRMVGADRLYCSDHTDFQVHVDGSRGVTSVIATLLPPDRPVDGACFGYNARRTEDGAEVPLDYGWALLLQLAHEVFAFPAAEAVALLNNIYREGYLPRTVGSVHLSHMAGSRFGGGERALCLLAELREEG